MRKNWIGPLGIVASLVVIGAAAACSDDEATGSVTPGPDASIRADSSTNDPADAAVLTEAQVLQVMTTANTGEVNQGMVAQSGATDPSVKSFADMMVTEHSQANERGVALAQTLGLTPAPSTVSMQLESESAAIVTSLQSLTGSALDKAYVDAQVSVHTKVLGIIDNQLIPSARSAPLTAELSTMRASVAMHLEHATMLQGQITADGGASDAGDAGDGGDGG
ncbi:MAG: hypothetical protein JWP97_2878 [Labilithrix sp.]|nr:hypothetical protein [Labilithrix sp.]